MPETRETILSNVTSAAQDASHARAAFYQAVCDAHALGIPLREIGAAAGLSHQRIHQIVHAGEV